MGFYYELQWPRGHEIVSVAATGNFDDWKLSEKAQLRENSNTGLFETTIRTEKREKLVFKFVINGSDWVTSDSLKIEMDEHGNQNNFVDPEELRSDIEDKVLSQKAKDIEEKAVKGGVPIPIQILPGDGVKSLAFSESNKVINSKKALNGDIVREEDFQERSSEELSDYSGPLKVDRSEDREKIATMSGEIKREISIKEVAGSEFFLAKSEIFEDDSIHLGSMGSQPISNPDVDIEEVSLAESSYTELSFITSNSHNTFQDLGEGLPSGEKSHFGSSNTSPSKQSTSTARETNAALGDFDPVGDDHISYLASDSDYKSDDEMDDIGRATLSEGSSTGGIQPGVFAKIRGLFKF